MHREMHYRGKIYFFKNHFLKRRESNHYLLNKRSLHEYFIQVYIFKTPQFLLNVREGFHDSTYAFVMKHLRSKGTRFSYPLTYSSTFISNQLYGSSSDQYCTVLLYFEFYLNRVLVFISFLF